MVQPSSGRRSPADEVARLEALMAGSGRSWSLVVQEVYARSVREGSEDARLHGCEVVRLLRERNLVNEAQACAGWRAFVKQPPQESTGNNRNGKPRHRQRFAEVCVEVTACAVADGVMRLGDVALLSVGCGGPFDCFFFALLRKLVEIVGAETLCWLFYEANVQLMEQLHFTQRTQKRLDQVLKENGVEFLQLKAYKPSGPSSD